MYSSIILHSSCVIKTLILKGSCNIARSVVANDICDQNSTYVVTGAQIFLSTTFDYCDNILFLVRLAFVVLVRN